MTTTVQGYEGTGRGFLLKFCASFAHLRQFSLTTPIRWASGCPLEAAIARLLLFNDETFQHAPGGDIVLESVSQRAGGDSLRYRKRCISCSPGPTIARRRWTSGA